MRASIAKLPAFVLASLFPPTIKTNAAFAAIMILRHSLGQVPYEWLSEAEKSLQRNTAAESIKTAISLGFKIQINENSRSVIVS